MIDFSTSVFEEEVKQLPEFAQQALRSIPWEKELEGLGKKYNLLIDEVGDLYAEVMLTLVGATPPESLETELSNRLGIPEKTAAELVADLNELVFKPLTAAAQKFSEGEPLSEDVKTLEKAGIDLAPNEPKVIAPTEPLHREDVLKGIEDPAVSPGAVSPAPVEPAKKLDPLQRFSKFFSMKPGKSDHSAPATPPPPNYEHPSKDPYLESLE